MKKIREKLPSKFLEKNIILKILTKLIGKQNFGAKK
jgi:hypothetical protein